MAVRPDTAPSPPARQSARSQDRGSGTPASAFNGLDAATARRVRRGRLSVDGRIDLHGMRQDEAHGALNRFIMAANARGWRCVLVITGKGDRARREDMEAVFMARRGQGEGVLKRMVPLWLGQEPLRSRIYSVQAAHQRDGGSGALYIFLKRGRT
ncbi:MAG: Smr/MutS family protein [Alphaproteobacteria bacterium]